MIHNEEFDKIIRDEQYSHLFLDTAMKKLAFQLAEQRGLKQMPLFEMEFMKSQGRLVEELQKLALSDENRYDLCTFGPDAYVVSTSDPFDDLRQPC